MVLVYLVIFQCLLVSGVGDCQFVEVGVVVCLFNDGVCLFLGCGDFIRGWVFWQWDQDVVQVEFGVGVVLVVDLFCQCFYFLWQYGDVMMYFIVMYF